MGESADVTAGLSQVADSEEMVNTMVAPCDKFRLARIWIGHRCVSRSQTESLKQALSRNHYRYPDNFVLVIHSEEHGFGGHKL
jgi:hypothetical protein